MKIVKEYPPFYKKILKSGMHPDDNVIFTFGHTIYNPHDVYIPGDFLIHEAMHSTQQGDNPKKWWKNYLKDPAFRIDQEAEAYAEQYIFLCKITKGREERFRMMSDFARVLASSVYGSLIGIELARKLIKLKVK